MYLLAVFKEGQHLRIAFAGEMLTPAFFARPLKSGNVTRQVIATLSRLNVWLN